LLVEESLGQEPALIALWCVCI